MAKKNELVPALAFGGAALFLTSMGKGRSRPAVKVDPLTTPPPPPSLDWQNRDYTFGIFVGAASMGLAWFVWSKGRPRLREWTRPPST